MTDVEIEIVFVIIISRLSDWALRGPSEFAMVNTPVENEIHSLIFIRTLPAGAGTPPYLETYQWKEQSLEFFLSK
jgi:hypothetical protein